MLKKFLGIFISVFAVFLMSHNTFAASRPGNYTGFVTNMTISPSGNINNNRVYNISGTNSALYIANGEYNVAKVWEDGKVYHFSLSVLVDGLGVEFVAPEAIIIQGDYYKSTNDTITSSVDCVSSTSCRYTVVHNIDIVGTGNGSEVIKTPSSNVLNVIGNGNFSGTFEMVGMLFDDEDEWADFKNDVSSALGDISSNTSDTVDILDQIYDRLDVLDSNADANAQAWDNMQNTEGLIDIGNQDGAMTIVNSINSVLGRVRDIPASATCSISGALGHNFDMGDINLCQGKDYFGGVVTFSATVIFLFISFLIVIRVIKKVLRLISWCRKN